jgi:hypothetical protein
MTYIEAINALRAGVDKLPPRSQDFARSLLSQFARRGDLSDKQWPYVVKLACEATEGPAPQKSIAVGSMQPLVALFAKAKEHLKRPAVVLEADGVGEIRLSEAGQRARVPGSINVTTPGPFGERVWYGRVTVDGFFQPTNKVAVPEPLVEAIRVFAADPVGQAARHGHLTGRCCFCNRKLEDERSTAVGYGPICADHFGLPWGAERTDIAELGKEV